MSVEIRTTREGDAEDLAPRLRELDLVEVYEAGGMDGLTALKASVLASDLSHTAVHEGKIVAMFGVAPSDVPGLGVPWFLASPEVGDLKRDMIVQGRKWVQTMLLLYQELGQLVFHRHQDSCRWLEILGFQRDQKVFRYGINNSEFYLYTCANQ